MESPESSSPIVTRAVAAGLRGQEVENFELPGWQRAGLELLGRLPQGVARAVIPPIQRLSAIPPASVAALTLDDLCRTRLADYAHRPAGDRLTDEGKHPALGVGAALGGTSAHLSLALDAPFLPQAFVITMQGGSYDGEVQTYFRRSHALALDFARRNPGAFTIQHYDPVHDNWLTRHVNHLRIKLIDLPPAYAQFIRSALAPGGAVVYLDCGAQWLRYRVGERSVFQVGGWGGLTPEEFLEPSERVQRFVRDQKMGHARWALDGFPLERGPESEWGSEPGLAEALAAFCQREGFQFIRLRLPHPNDFSRLAFRAVQRLLEKDGREPAGTLVECFTQFDAQAVMQTGLLPLWLIFNTTDSLDFLRTMAPHFPRRRPVFLSPLATFSLTPDLVPYPDWLAALPGLETINIGARPSHYPADAWAIVHWADALRAWVKQNTQPVKARLSADELDSLSGSIGR